jgi:hypothetical protein
VYVAVTVCGGGFAYFWILKGQAYKLKWSDKVIFSVIIFNLALVYIVTAPPGTYLNNVAALFHISARNIKPFLIHATPFLIFAGYRLNEHSHKRPTRKVVKKEVEAEVVTTDNENTDRSPSPKKRRSVRRK